MAYQDKVVVVPEDAVAPNALEERCTTRLGGDAVHITDHLRLWFLQHLAYPYPTPNEKDSLISLTNSTRSKIDSDLTNWRRRAGWTDIKDKFAQKSKDRMRTLIERVESGKECRKDVLDAVEGMKAYLERRREEKVGDWVHEVSRRD